MATKSRKIFTEEEHRRCWQLQRQGLGYSDIGQGLTIRTIATQLERSPSTISRELNRNGGVDCYRAAKAEQKAWKSACRPTPCKLASAPELCDFITEKLLYKGSPQQISGWLSRIWTDNQCMQISHETIYKSLYLQARGDRGTIRIVNGLSISDRPPEVADRAVPGRWGR